MPQQLTRSPPLMHTPDDASHSTSSATKPLSCVAPPTPAHSRPLTCTPDHSSARPATHRNSAANATKSSRCVAPTLQRSTTTLLPLDRARRAAEMHCWRVPFLPAGKRGTGAFL
eukprot:156896-Chlamydomonas_euryale.AAC.1